MSLTPTLTQETRAPNARHQSPHDREALRFNIVLVCVDNRTRSVLGEQLLRHALRRHGVNDIRVTALGGHKFNPTDQIHPTARTELVRRGLDLELSTPTQFNGQHLASADLVLTFEREHRTELYQYAPRMFTHAFTLPELAAISRAAPNLPHLPRHQRIPPAAQLRALGAHQPDIPETWNQPPTACIAAAEAIERATADLVTLLA